MMYVCDKWNKYVYQSGGKNTIEIEDKFNNDFEKIST